MELTVSLTAATGTNFLGVLNDTVNGALRIGRVNTTLAMKEDLQALSLK